ncbi:DUF2236 domain-containing protein [Erythrobacteraceae bacterium CFH 75059]|uniref:oxygenase MpaB family protein n=1 Tax=Qipengyuania thermophila TaxID=2509361 RepID=UPI001021EDEF|nr:oxygenase MpaB family protein [Qipengyuania thermophila]TCD04932.1 DUF2236 domain-containing protein [Erythrobacteraceae bacterium CFH 75059]
MRPARPQPFEPVADAVRAKLVARVRSIFNDSAAGEAPVLPSDDALFERDSPIRLVHADVVSMMVGGLRSLLLQMLHPHALQGVLDHSDFRVDMHGRLRRTARFIALTTYGERAQAEAAIAAVNRIHERVSGNLPDGTPYSAREPRVLAWVHLAGAHSFLAAYTRLTRPDFPASQQDAYYRQFAVIARKLGADPIPHSRAEAERLMKAFRGDLRTSAEARDVARIVLAERPAGAPAALQKMIAAEAVAMLPPFARAMLNLPHPGPLAVAARAGTRAAGSTLRWAFRRPHPDTPDSAGS